MIVFENNKQNVLS